MKGLNALCQCRNSKGKSWGLPPRGIRWTYLATVRPFITYGCVVWWCSLDKGFQRKILDKVQRIASLCIIGVRKSCPQAAHDTMVCLNLLTSVGIGLLKTALDRSLQSSEGRLFWWEVFTLCYSMFSICPLLFTGQKYEFENPRLLYSSLLHLIFHLSTSRLSYLS